MTASRGRKKWSSLLQETFIANRYVGKRSPSSGAANNDSGDVRTDALLVECKCTEQAKGPAKSIRILVEDFEKIADEAWAEGRIPAMAFRIYHPGSVLADEHGFIDLITYRVADDVERKFTYRDE